MKINSWRLAALIVGVMTVALVATALPRPGNKPPTKAKQHYDLAQEYLAKNERDKAIAELRAAIKLAPEFVEAHHSYLASQKPKAAALLAEYQDYAKRKPKSPVFQYLLAKAYAQASRDQEAEAAYQKTLALNPEFSWALLDKGKQVLDRNYEDREKAADLWEKACKKAGDSVTLNMTLATNLNNAGRGKPALAAAERVLQLEPKHFAAYYAKWRAKLSVTKGAEATQAEITQDAKRLETQYPTDPKALDAARSGYSMLFDTADAERVKKAILAINPKFYDSQGGARMMTTTASGKRLEFSGPLADRFFAADRLTDLKERLAALEKVAGEMDDPDLKIYVLNPALITTHLRLGQLESAERLAEEMEKAGAGARLPSSGSGFARIYLDRKIKLDLAEQYLTKAIEANRTNLARYEKMSLNSDQEYAIRNIKNTLAGNLQLQARLFLLRDLKDKAFATLTESVTLAEQEANTLDLGLLYVGMGKPEEAIALLTKAYSFEGSRKEEAKSTLERIYGEREKSVALTALLKEAVEGRKKAREAERATTSGSSVSKLIGQAAPTWELPTVTGERIRLAALQGKIVLLNFWATW